MILQNVVTEMPLEVQSALRPQIERIAIDPTEEEKGFELQDVAQEIVDILAKNRKVNRK